MPDLLRSARQPDLARGVSGLGIAPREFSEAPLGPCDAWVAARVRDSPPAAAIVRAGRWGRKSKAPVKGRRLRRTLPGLSRRGSAGCSAALVVAPWWETDRYGLTGIGRGVRNHRSSQELLVTHPHPRATSTSANPIETPHGLGLRAWSTMADREWRGRRLIVLLRSPYPAVEAEPAPRGRKTRRSADARKTETAATRRNGPLPRWSS
jgi:hypothetical protein